MFGIIPREKYILINNYFVFYDFVRFWNEIKIYLFKLIMQTYIKEINRCLETKRYEEAILLCFKLLPDFPKEPSVWHSLGCGLYYTGRFTEAIAAFQNAINQKPDFWLAGLFKIYSC